MLIKFHYATQYCYFCSNSTLNSIVQMKINLSYFLLLLVWFIFGTNIWATHTLSQHEVPSRIQTFEIYFLTYFNEIYVKNRYYPHVSLWNKYFHPVVQKLGWIHPAPWSCWWTSYFATDVLAICMITLHGQTGSHCMVRYLFGLAGLTEHPSDMTVYIHVYMSF